jgi:asparagine synthase (glutamine-hydrolysing)
MCGILGVVSYNGELNFDSNRFKEAFDTLTHRGPDEEGIHTGKNFIIGTKRLKIIDLEKGKQPIHNENKTIWVSYNGEIYNFQELKDYLIKKNHIFYTNTDTEVIVHLYEEYGINCINYLEGMFAFAIIDKRKKLCFLVRDRFGIKPLYYLIDKDKLLFASELKAIIKLLNKKLKINIEALNFYFLLNYIPSPYSIYENLYKLESGHLLIFNNSGVKIKKYYSLNIKEQKISNFTKAKEFLDDLLNKTIKKHLISDAPLGIFLSGGIDSSILAYESKKTSPELNSFTIGFREKSYDESHYAKKASSYLGLKNNLKFFSEDELLNLLPNIPKLLDEPFADLAFLPTYLLSKFASQKVKVILSGDGGDEIFAGYQTYIAHNLYRIYKLLPFSFRKIVIHNIINSLPVSYDYFSFEFCSRKFISGDGLNDIARHIKWMGIFNENRESILKKDFYRAIEKKFLTKDSVENWLTKFQVFDIATYLEEDILYKTDRATMLNSIEARVPYLDHNIVEFALSLPYNLRLNKIKNTKYILRSIYKNKLPNSIIEKKKKGFTLPISYWLRFKLKNLCNEVLMDNKNDFLNEKYIEKLLNYHFKGEKDYGRQLWNLIVFKIWHESNF